VKARFAVHARLEVAYRIGRGLIALHRYSGVRRAASGSLRTYNEALHLTGLRSWRVVAGRTRVRQVCCAWTGPQVSFDALAGENVFWLERLGTTPCRW